MTSSGRAPIRTVLIAGWGVMGKGIVRSFNNDRFTVQVLSRRAASLTDLPDGVTAVASLPQVAPDLIIETTTEEMAPKLALYAEIEAAYGGRTIIGTNTSGLALDQLGAGLTHPGQFLGVHYMMPADLFPMVEIIALEKTDKDVVAAAAQAIIDCGKEPIHVAKPVVGFLINRLQHAILHEAYHLIAEGAATPADIDAVAKRLLGPRMCVTGLIEQKDISGLVIHSQAQRSIIPALAHDHTPNPLLQGLAARGEIGVKAGKGWYDWSGIDAQTATTSSAARLKHLLDFLETQMPAPILPRSRDDLI
jgi:3-hydroxybutyryl-CoA dehydrogenase